MRPLTLDYSSKRKLGLKGVAVCVLASLWMGYALDQYVALNHKEAELHAKVKKLQHSLRHAADAEAASAIKTSDDSEIIRANKTINRLTVPWESLFQAVEAANFIDAALLAIQPELDKQLLVLTAEAKDLPSMLEYIRRLSGESVLVKAELVSHQVQQQDPQKPVRFVVHAGWAAR